MGFVQTTGDNSMSGAVRLHSCGPGHQTLASTSAPSQGGFCPAARAGTSQKASYKGPIGPERARAGRTQLPLLPGTISSLFV